MVKSAYCKHIQAIKKPKVSKDHVCEACIKTGDEWVHLRTCQTCGVTLCCDQSPNRHMTKHFHQTDHPVIMSAEPGEQWMYCYKDDQFTADE